MIYHTKSLINSLLIAGSPQNHACPYRLIDTSIQLKKMRNTISTDSENEHFEI